MNQAHTESPIFKKQFVAATSRIGPAKGTMKDHRTLRMLLRSQGEGDGKGIVATKVTNLRADRIVTRQLHALTGHSGNMDSSSRRISFKVQMRKPMGRATLFGSINGTALLGAFDLARFDFCEPLHQGPLRTVGGRCKFPFGITDPLFGDSQCFALRLGRQQKSRCGNRLGRIGIESRFIDIIEESKELIIFAL